MVTEFWEAHARYVVEQQPGVQKILIDALWKYYSIPYDGLANFICHWCSSSTIRSWVISREGYTMYSERVIPLLSNIQKKTFVFFKEIVKRLGEREEGVFMDSL